MLIQLSDKVGLTIKIYLVLALAIAISRLPFLFGFHSVHVPVFFLGLREILFFACLGYFVFISTQKLSLYVLAIICSLIAGQLLMNGHSFSLIAFGFKNLLPFLFVFCLPNREGLKINDKVWDRILLILFSANFLLQVLHLIFGYGFYAKFALIELNARNPGFFFFPAVSALFSLLLFCMYSSTKTTLKSLPVLLMLVSVGLCASLTGMAGAVLLLILNRDKIGKQDFWKMFFVLLLSAGYLHLARLSMTGSTYLKETGGGRIEIIEQASNEASFFGVSNFGKYTNAAASYTDGKVADSQYSALIGNLGGFWTIVIFLYIAWMLFLNYKKGNELDIMFLVLLCSFGLNIGETGFAIFLAILSRFVQVSNNEKFVSLG